MEALGTSSTGGGAAPAAGSRQWQSQYMQLALYLAGNALTVVIGLLIWNLNSVLADFRDSMLYALLCSIALRPVKEWLVAQLDARLADPRRSVGGALLSLAALPLNALVDAWEEGRAILAKWRQAVQEEFQRRQAAIKRSAAAAAAAAAASPTSPRTPRTAAAAAAAAATAAKASAAPMHTMPSLAVYGHAAVRVLKSRRTSKKRRKQRQQARRAPEGSNVLFRWLFRSVAAWLLWEWVRDSWSTTVQVVLLVFTALLALGLLPLLLLASNRYLGSSSLFSPVKTPTASATQGTAAEGHPRRGILRSLSPVKPFPCFSPFSEGRQQRRAAGGAADAACAGTSAAGAAAGDGWWERCRSTWQAAKAAAADVVRSLDAGLRSALRSNLHALVSLMLILGLFVGTTGLAAFLSVRVVQEGRNTVLAVRDVFPTAWAGMAASSGVLADAEAAAAAAAGEGGSLAGAVGSKQLPAAAAVVLPAWVASYQKEAVQLVQQALPAVASWAEARLYGFVEKQNLTAALGDIRLLYETVQGPRHCSEREREKITVALAKSEVTLAKARVAKSQAQQQLSQSRSALHAAVVRLEAERRSNGSSSSGGGGCSDGTEPGLPSRHAGAAGGDASSEEPLQALPPPSAAPPPIEGLLSLEQAVVAADVALARAKQQRKAATLAADVAEREQRAALSRLQLCSEEPQGGHQSSLLPGLAGEVAASLQRAYAKLWRRQLREGLAEMRRAAAACAAALRGAAHRGSDAVADLSSLQRLLQAAADPLISVGRVAGRLFAGSVGSTTAAALMGGLGVLRLGMGVVKLGMQLMLFLALLYYLLAAQSDPLLAAAGVLPLSEHGRQRTAVALNRALGGVLVSSMKLIAFHGCFSWITFRVMQLPLTYTASVASAVCALLPFVPTYAAALPGCVVLLAQGRLLASILFFALHFMGYYIGDTAILEDIPGGHPYMLSLGILGGIYAFENPLQGCLLGPILLSLLSVFYNLHSEFMGSSGSGTAAAGGPLHRLWSLTPGGGTGQKVLQGQGRQQQQPQQQPHQPPAQPQPRVRLALGELGGSNGGGGSPDAMPTGLRVSVPSRLAAMAVPSEAEAGDAYSPVRRWSDAEYGFGDGDDDASLVSPGLWQMQPQPQPQRSVSLSLGQRPSSRGGLQDSPAQAASWCGVAARRGGPGGGLGGAADDDSEGLQAEDGEGETGSQTMSASLGDSFSFNALRSLKLHDD